MAQVRTFFGCLDRYVFIEMETRFGNTTYLIEDSFVPDSNGFPAVIFQDESLEKAFAFKQKLLGVTA